MMQYSQKLLSRKPANSPIFRKAHRRIQSSFNQRQNLQFARYISPNHTSTEVKQTTIINPQTQKYFFKSNRQNQDLQKQINKLLQQKEAVITENYQLKQKITGYQQEITCLKKELSGKNSILEELSTQNDNLLANSQTFSNFSLFQDNQYENLMKKNKFLEDNIESCNSIIKKLQSSLSSAQISLNILERKVMKRQKQITKLKFNIERNQLYELSEDEK